jgi:hypothetical protein
MLTRAETEAIVLQAEGYPQHDEVTRAKLRAIAARKHELEAAAFREFAAVDQAAYTERISASLASAVAALGTAREAEGEAERKAGEALRAERRAQDRARDHVGYARKQEQTWQRVKGRGTPQKQADALRDAQAAALVAQGEQAAAEGKAAARDLGDRELEAARARVATAELALQAAQELASHPGRALYSPETCAENVPHMLRIWDSLQPLEQQLVRNTVSMFAMLTGVYDDIKAKGGAERETELEGGTPGRAPGLNLGSAVAGMAGR